MGLKAGWLALFAFVWIIGAILGSTFDYQSTEAAVGLTYSTGTATFTNDSNIVTPGGGATWIVSMQNGNIRSNTDAVWYKIRNVGGGVLSNGTGFATGSPLTLNVGANAVTVTGLGTFTIVLPVGNTGTATSGVTTVVGSPVALVAGTNTITTTGVTGGITVTTVGTAVVFLYAPYANAGGAGMAYTMQPTPGWAGTGTGGYVTGATTKFSNLISVLQAHQELPLMGRFVLIVMNGDFWSTAFEVVTWQWSFLNVNNYPLFYLVFCAPFVIMGVLSMILLVYGIISANLTWG